VDLLELLKSFPKSSPHKTSSANCKFEIDQSQALSNYKSKKRDEISLAAWVKVQITN
jgi:hypothetical protein